MKLCFTTLGCLDWKLDRIVQKAVEFGYAGVDFRGLEGELDLWKICAFRDNCAQTRQRFVDAGLCVSCLSSSARMYAPPSERFAMREELLHYIEMAHNIGADYVRVFGGALKGVSIDDALPAAATFLIDAAAIGREAGVEVLIETHDDWVNSAWLKAAFFEAGSPAGVGLIWDVHHPYRLGGEAPGETWAQIGPLVKYTHWKDSKRLPAGEGSASYTLTLPGEGDLPLAQFYRLLTENGYDGWYAFEWERKWHPEIEPPEVAFPHFIDVMRKLEAEGAEQG